MDKRAKNYTPVGELLRRNRDEKISKTLYPRLWRARLSKLEKALTRHDFPTNMSRGD